MGLCIFSASCNSPVPQGLCYMTAHVFEASEMKFGDISSILQAISVPLLPKTPVCDMMFPIAESKSLADSIKCQDSTWALLNKS